MHFPTLFCLCTSWFLGYFSFCIEETWKLFSISSKAKLIKEKNQEILLHFHTLPNFPYFPIFLGATLQLASKWCVYLYQGKFVEYRRHLWYSWVTRFCPFTGSAILFGNCLAWILLYRHSADNVYGILSSFVSLQLPMMFSEDKGTTCMPLSLQLRWIFCIGC